MRSQKREGCGLTTWRPRVVLHHARIYDPVITWPTLLKELKSGIPGPPFAVTEQPYGPTGVLDSEGRRFVTEQAVMTDDLESEHRKRSANAAEGEMWLAKGWTVDRAKELLYSMDI